MNQPFEQRSWLKRNLAWVLAIGIGGGLLLACGLILVSVFGMIKSSDAYQLGYTKAVASPAVIAAIGTPIESGLLVSGNISTSGASGSAELAIPLNGPKGKGTAYLRARKSLGVWTLSRLVYEDDATRKRIDLVGDAEANKDSQ